jgi:hypothetical protein
MSKRFALILYGELRTYQKACKYLKTNLLDINNIDIFISTHHNDMLSSHNIVLTDKNDLFINCYGDNLKGISYIEDNDLNELFDILRTKIKLIDSELYVKYEQELTKMTTFHDWSVFYKKVYNKDKSGFYFKNKENHTYILHELIQLYHRLNAFRLLELYSKKENVTYDGVIIYRLDLYFSIPLDLSKFVFNDQTIYFRLEFLLMSSVNGIKKLVTNLLYDYYCNKNIKYTESLNDSLSLNISEHQHNMFLWNKKYYLHAFDILDILIHYRALNGEGPDYILYAPIQIEINRKELFDLNYFFEKNKECFNKTLNDINLNLTEIYKDK